MCVVQLVLALAEDAEHSSVDPDAPKPSTVFTPTYLLFPTLQQPATTPKVCVAALYVASTAGSWGVLIGCVVVVVCDGLIVLSTTPSR